MIFFDHILHENVINTHIKSYYLTQNIQIQKYHLYKMLCHSDLYCSRSLVSPVNRSRYIVWKIMKNSEFFRIDYSLKKMRISPESLTYFTFTSKKKTRLIFFKGMKHISTFKFIKKSMKLIL